MSAIPAWRNAAQPVMTAPYWLLRAGGCISSFEWSQKKSLAWTLLPNPLIGSVPIECACGEVVMCHAPHAGTFLEKGWIEEIFNRNRENNKEMNRDNKINGDS